jgi:toxin ParE1/3/4
MKVWYAPRARNDIDRIHQYIAEHNPKAATAVVRKIRTTARTLGRHPRLGRQTQLPEVRVIGVGRYPYLMYYRIGPSELTIIHVRDGRRASPSADDLQ